MFPTTPILDDFNRANEGPPMTGWTAYYSTGLKVVSNQCAPNDNGGNAAYWTPAMGGSDVECYVTIATMPANGGETAVLARLDPAGGGVNGDAYQVSHFPAAGTDSITIWRIDNSAYTSLGSWSQELAAGDGIGIRCVGSTIEAWARISGVWTLIGSVTDATYSGASPTNRIALSNEGNGSSVARYDDFGGGVMRHVLAALGAGV